MRNFQKLKELSDYEHLDAPVPVYGISEPPYAYLLPSSVMILRMLVRPKYGNFRIPRYLNFLKEIIHQLSEYDAQLTGIYDSWCYITVRHGNIQSETDDEWHFDGSSFRTDIIPERNYIWASNHPTEYKLGDLQIPTDFNPNVHNLFTFAAKQLENEPIHKTNSSQWHLLSPFCLHRRPIINKEVKRTFYRISFTDIEGRDINNTHNPLLATPFYGRNPVDSFRNKLVNYYEGR